MVMAEGGSTAFHALNDCFGSPGCSPLLLLLLVPICAPLADAPPPPSCC